MSIGTAAAQSVGNSADRMEGRYEARGLLRAVTRLELTTALQAPVSEAPFRSGDHFAEGDTLIAFDCSRYDAELAAAKAGANAAWIDHKSKKRLLSHQAIGRDEVSLAAAKASQASAEQKIREVVMEECTIKAPFDGRVVDIAVGLHEYPPTAAPFMILLDDRRIEIELVVPSRWLRWLTPGLPIELEIEETGTRHAASLTRIGAEVDPVSQTVTVFGEMEASPGVLAGMSGNARFTPPSTGSTGQ